MVRIAIDTRSFVNKTSGIGNYIRAFVPRVLKMADDIQFTLIRHPKAGSLISGNARIREITVPSVTKSLYTVFKPGLGAKLSDFDLYHSPTDMVPPGLRCPFVVTSHDLMWIEASKLASGFFPVRWLLHHWYSSTFGYALRKSSAIIAISRATAEAIKRNFPEYGPKISVIHHGVDIDQFDPSRTKDRSSLDSWLSREYKYSLTVGQGSPYKNHANIVRAFLKATHDQPDHKLILVRRFSRIDLEMTKLLSDPQVKRKVIVRSHVSDEELRALYRHARMLAFISHYEGFGLPVLEAMAMGTPVITSYAPALIEISGDSALHADANDISDIADKIQRLDKDEALRKRLIMAGMKNVQKFSWEKCAKEIFEVYRKTLAEQHKYL